ncbi:iron reductase domain protein [Aplosporella prunicola CBS 121167]|uniref:Iron reductase domain protein n=1 Tax=Aplosporella prunicola CBS 121167 TaxID=1176127 RepID=A0A6A6B9G3_9PEZI|nr:iron reductase domain protein [Aplosporella prunicola CBS 121167]KAF2139557.1 iron reductase domain protein [Aplosporella prunicola CBS 121167]
MLTTRKVAAALIGLASTAYAQVSSACQGDVCFGLNIPENTASSGDGDIFFQLTAPTSYSWVALGQGGSMSGSNIFVMYTSADGKNVTLSPRLGTGHVMPNYNEAAKVTLLDGSGVSNGKMVANVKCSNCNSWSGGSMDFTSSDATWIYASKSGSALNTDDKSQSISQHGRYGKFTWDFAQAKGGSSVNPFTSSSSTSGSGSSGATGTRSCTPRSSSNSGSNSGSTSAGSSGGSTTTANGGYPWTGRPTARPTGYGGWNGNYPNSVPSGLPWPGPNSKRASDDNYCDDDGSSSGGNSVNSFGANPSNPLQLSGQQGLFGSHRDMLIAHGVLACLAFVIFFPFGAISIRLFSFPSLIWFHAAIQILGYMLFIAAFGIGVYIATQMKAMDMYHPIIGIVLFVLLFFQPILGFMHHALFKKYRKRTLWSYGHLWLGRIIITLGIINGGLGLLWADNAGQSAYIAYGVVGGIIWLIYVFAAIYGEIKRARTPPAYAGSPPRKGSGTSNSPVSSDRREEYYGRAPLCQVYDSIFLDVPMSRVKFDAKNEYTYLQNFKILQNTFAKHAIDHPLHIESLVKCKMQDNLEFLQFTKRYWDQYFPGGDYDAPSRRKGAGAPASGGARAGGAPRAGSSTARRVASTSSSAAAAPPRTRTPQSSAQTAALTQENNALKETVAGLERERDFYFSKLRDIELLIQNAMEADPELEKDEGLLKSIQNILYSTEEGFEIPAELEGEIEEEEETF